MSKLVLDSMVFIYGFRVDGDLITVPDVMNELKDEKSIMIFELAKDAGMKVEQAEKHYVSLVEKEAQSTGDFDSLSRTDIHLLAKALQYLGEGTYIVSDDYEIQNMASRLGVKVKKIIQKGIRDVLIWEKHCIGCNRCIKNGNTCPVCGSRLKKKLKRKE
ncbi:MAG: DNA-binding protein [Methanocellales archaeon]|nr:DNA-binding protein [Methanocellales archaeon]